MYIITIDDVVVFDLNKDIVNITNPKLKLETNKTGSFTFEYYDKNIIIKKLKSIIKIYDNNILIYEGRAIEEDSNFYNILKVTCEGAMSYFLDSYIRPYEHHDMRVRNYLQWLIDRHNERVDDNKKFKLGNVTVEDGNDSLYRKSEKYVKCFDEINEKLIKRLGGYFSIRYENNKEKYVDYLKAESSKSEQLVKFGENLLDLTKQIDATEVKTVIIPLGATVDKKQLTIESVNQGKDFLIDEEAIKLVGRIEGIVEYNDVTIAENLKQKGIAYLKNCVNLSLTIKLTAVDLSYLNIKLNRLKLGMLVTVVSDPHNFKGDFIIQKMEIDFMDIGKSKIELGKVYKTMTEYSQTNEIEGYNIVKNVDKTIIYIESEQDRAFKEIKDLEKLTIMGI